MENKSLIPSYITVNSDGDWVCDTKKFLSGEYYPKTVGTTVIKYNGVDLIKMSDIVYSKEEESEYLLDKQKWLNKRVSYM